jgi:carbonic anhydrase
MKKVLMVVLVLVLSVAGVVAAETAAGVSPEDALANLMAGNEKFTQGNLANLIINSKPAVREELVKGQHPYAVIVDCSDSRLAPEIIFDKGLGEIFVVRVAGNIVADHQLGSIEYAIEHLGARLVMVLGHSKCGAVNATVGALDKATCVVPEAAKEGKIGSLVTTIAPAVEKSCHDGAADLLGASINENVNMVAENIEKALEETLKAKQGKIVKARYDLEDGVVKLLAGEEHAH